MRSCQATLDEIRNASPDDDQKIYESFTQIANNGTQNELESLFQDPSLVERINSSISQDRDIEVKCKFMSTLRQLVLRSSNSTSFDKIGETIAGQLQLFTLRKCDRGSSCSSVQSICKDIIFILCRLTANQQMRETLKKVIDITIVIKFLEGWHENVQCEGLKLLFSLSSASTDVRLAISAALPKDLLIRLLCNDGPGRPAVTGLLANICFDDTVLKASILDNEEVLKAFIRNLKEGMSNPLVHQTCRALFVLSSMEANKHKIVSANLLEPLSAQLWLFNEDIIRNALGAIANICTVQRYKLSVSGALFFRRLSELPPFPAISTKRQLARLYFSLTGNTGNLDLLIKCNAIQALTQLVNLDDVGVQKNSLGAIANMAIDGACKGLLLNSNLPKRIIQLLSTQDLEVARQSTRACFSLTTNTKMKVYILQTQASTITSLIQSGLRFKCNHILRNIAGLIANLIIGGRFKENEETDNSLADFLVELLSNKDAGVLSQTTRCLFALSAGSLAQKKKILQAGAIPRLADVLSRVEDKIQTNICGTLANLAVEFPDEIIKGNFVPKLMELFCKSYDPSTRKHALRVFKIFDQGKKDYCFDNHRAGVSGDQHEFFTRLHRLFQALWERAASREVIERYSEIVEPDLEIHLPLYAARPNSIREDDRMEEVAEVLWWSFPCHGIIAAVRCKTIMSQIYHCLASDHHLQTNMEQHRTVSMALPEDMGATKEAWKCIFEYIYADSIPTFNNLSQAEQNQVYKEAAVLARKLNLGLLGHKLNNMLPNSQVPPRVCTWFEDFARLSTIDELPRKQDKLEHKQLQFVNEALANASIRSSIEDQPVEIQDKRRKTINPAQGLCSSHARVVRSHQVLLSLRSDYFATLFCSKSGWARINSENQNITIDASEKAFEILIHFINNGLEDNVSGRLQEDLSVSLELLILSQDYDFASLSRECAFLLYKNLSVENVLIIYQECISEALSAIRVACLLYMISKQMLPSLEAAIKLNSETPLIYGHSMSRLFLVQLCEELKEKVQNWKL